MTKKDLIEMLKEVKDDDKIFVLLDSDDELDLRVKDIDYTYGIGYAHIIV